MASGHVNRANRPNTWLHRPATRREILLANPEPSTHGTFLPSQSIGWTSVMGRTTDLARTRLEDHSWLTPVIALAPMNVTYSVSNMCGMIS